MDAANIASDEYLKVLLNNESAEAVIQESLDRYIVARITQEIMKLDAQKWSDVLKCNVMPF